MNSYFLSINRGLPFRTFVWTLLCAGSLVITNGVLADNGPGNPHPIRWVDTGNHRPDTSISAGTYTVTNTVIPVGGDPGITIEDDGSDYDESEEKEQVYRNGAWEDTGNTDWYSVSDTVTGEVSTSSTSVVAPDYSTPGEKTLYIIWDDAPYATDADDPLVASAAFTVTVVQVASVGCGGITSTTDTPGDDETYHVAIGASGDTVTLTAAPSPSGDWPQSEPTWSSNVTQSTSDPSTATFAIDTASTDSDGDTVTVSCGDSTVAIKIVVVEVGNIQITENSNQDDVGGEDIYLLRGTKYTFTAIPNPVNADWPSGQPTWTGLSSSSGVETTDLTFGTNGAFWLSCACGVGDSGTTVNIHVISLTVKIVNFTGEDIQDKEDRWEPDPAPTPIDPNPAPVNDPACYVQNTNTTVTLVLDAPQSLTYDTRVKFRGDVHALDEYVTGEDYGRANHTIRVMPSAPLAVNSEALAEAAVKDDYDVDITWRFEVEWGTDTWYDMTDTNNLRYYLILNNHVGTQFIDEQIAWAVAAAEGETAEAGVVDDIYAATHSDYPYDNNHCLFIASYMTRGLNVHGINPNLTYVRATTTRSQIYNDPVGGLYVGYPTNAVANIGAPMLPNDDNWGPWVFHSWVDHNGVQYDASSGATLAGTVVNYEDACFWGYREWTTGYTYVAPPGGGAGGTWTRQHTYHLNTIGALDAGLQDLGGVIGGLLQPWVTPADYLQHIRSNWPLP